MTDEERHAEYFQIRAKHAIEAAKAMRTTANKMARLAKLDEWTDEQRKRWPDLVQAARAADHRLVNGGAL